MENQNDFYYMQRCIQLALQGLGTVAPNPLVGAVIVHQNKIIGEGAHLIYGGPHAEVNAIASVRDKSLLSESTLYVNLEPCSHYGKTPPCADLIIAMKIPRVVIGMQDPFSEVNGSGIQKLQGAGVEVIASVLETESKILNKRFITFHQYHRPYLLLKWAQSADHFTGKQGEKIQISNELSKRYSHQWRTEESAILVGSTTAIVDNPRLDVRYWPGKSPLRILFDRTGKLQTRKDLQVFDGQHPTLVFTNTENAEYPHATVVTLDPTKDFIQEALTAIYQQGIQSIIIEGGATLQNEFLLKNLWDEARVFTSSENIGSGIKAPDLKRKAVTVKTLGNNSLSIYTNISHQ